MPWMNEEQLKQFKKVGRNVKVADDITVFGAENVEIGDNTRIDTGTLILAAAPGAFLRLGAHIHVASRAVFMASGGIEIDDFSTVGFMSTLISASDNFDGSCLVGPVFDEDFLKVRKAPIRTEKHCIITTNCTVLPGVRMLEGSVLGAMSLLKDRTNPWTIYAGIPAKSVGTRSLMAKALGEEWLERFEEKMSSL